MPVAALSAGGNPRVRRGSRNTQAANSSRWPTTRLMPSCVSVSTASRPSSEPVPAVVGSASSGGRPSGG